MLSYSKCLHYRGKLVQKLDDYKIITNERLDSNFTAFYFNTSTMKIDAVLSYDDGPFGLLLCHSMEEFQQTDPNSVLTDVDSFNNLKMKLYSKKVSPKIQVEDQIVEEAINKVINTKVEQELV